MDKSFSKAELYKKIWRKKWHKSPSKYRNRHISWSCIRTLIQSMPLKLQILMRNRQRLQLLLQNLQHLEFFRQFQVRNLHLQNNNYIQQLQNRRLIWKHLTYCLQPGIGIIRSYRNFRIRSYFFLRYDPILISTIYIPL